MSNWFPIGKEGAKTTYTSKELCEITEGAECFEVSNVDVEVSKVIEVDVPVMIEVIKQRPLLDEQGQPVLDEAGQPVMEDYGDTEQAVDENGDPVFAVEKQIVDDEAKKAAKTAKESADEAAESSKDALLANLKANGSKDIKDLIEILGL